MYNIRERLVKNVFSKKKISDNACCARCKMRGEQDGDFYNCKKRGRVKKSDVCKRYDFDPFAPVRERPRKFDTSMLDPLDFDIDS